MLLYVCVCVLLKVTKSQFPDHTDLQKISEIMFKGEKYYVLKPTIHTINDYFKDFVQKRSNQNFPSKKVFIDKNGFRHFWRGMELNAPTSLRKADLSRKEFNLASANETKVENNTAKLKKDISYLKNGENKTDQVTNVKTKNSVIIKEKPRRKKKVKDVFVPAKPSVRKGATQIRTTFFCPHFGVITMTTNVDNFDEV